MPRHSFSVLMYHDVEDVPRNQYSVSYRTLEEQLCFLKDEGFVVEGFPELENRLKTASLPERYILLAFDDGAKSSLRAAEIVRKHCAQATFFLTKDFSTSSSPRYINSREIKELSQICSIGSHGVSHRYLSKLPTLELKRELTESKVWLEELVGESITSLSAPGGFIDDRVVRLAQETGYTLLGNSVEKQNTLVDVAEKQLLNRVAMRQHFDLSTFRSIAFCEQVFFLKRKIRSSLLDIPKTLLSEAQIRGLCRAVGR